MIPQEADQTHIKYGFPVYRLAPLRPGTYVTEKEQRGVDGGGGWGLDEHGKLWSK